MVLTDALIRNAKPQSKLKKLSDGGGLQLWIQPTGGKLWRLAYRFGGKQKLLSIGVYPAVSLVDARAAREDAKRLLRGGIDPMADKRRKKLEHESAGNSFRQIAEELTSKFESEGRAKTTIMKRKWLLGFAIPSLGNRPINDITAAEVLAVLRKVEARGNYETARRLRSTIGSIFRYAIATARAEDDPTFALKGALITPKVTHRSAIVDDKEFGALLRSIDGYVGQPTTQAALKLMALLFPRPGELRLAEWKEFDLDKSTWVIPSERTKMRRAHRVPLPDQAKEILSNLHALTGFGSLVFPSVRSSHRSISDNTLNTALRQMGYAKEQMSAHGFRATASTLLNESGKWNPDAIERALAHVESNDVRRAYLRGEHWEERVQMAQWWADYLDLLRTKKPANQFGNDLS